MSDYPMLISNKLHSFRNFPIQRYEGSVRCQMVLRLATKKAAGSFFTQFNNRKLIRK